MSAHVRHRRDSKRRRVVSRVIGVVAFVLTISAVAAVLASWWFYVRPEKQVKPGSPVTVTIAEGAGTQRIAEQLLDAGVIGNAFLFRNTARDAGVDGDLKPGTYKLATGMPDDIVIEKLIAGPEIMRITVTIPEGFVIDQIAERLERKVGIPAEEFVTLAKGGAAEFSAEHPYLKEAYNGSLEGYLFPKTYEFKEGTSAREAIETMLDQFDAEIASVDLAAAEKVNLTLADVVNIAAMVEREASVDKERPLVASVVYNRLRRDMRLQICATVEYVTPGNRLRLTADDLKIQSPYNTYLHAGLPPGPIANPGLLSLQAAADPAETDYIYYVLTGKDGTHTFATNDADFLAAKQRSKEVFGE